MYNNHPHESNTKWSFMTTLLFVGLALILGIVIANSQIFQPQITTATAERMSIENNIAMQKAQLELQALQRQAELDRQLQEQEAANKLASAKMTQELQQKVSEYLSLGIYLAVLVALALVTVMGVSVSTMLIKRLQEWMSRSRQTRRVQQVVHEAQPQGKKEHREPSIEAQRAREVERLRNEARLHSQKNPLENTQTTWSAQDQKSHDITRNLPHAE